MVLSPHSSPPSALGQHEQPGCLAYLAELGELLAGDLGLGQTLPRCLSPLARTLEARVVALFLPDGEDGYVQAMTFGSQDVLPESPGALTALVEQSIADRRLLWREAVVEGGTPLVCAPLLKGGAGLGAVIVATDAAATAKQDVETCLRTTASLLSLALSNLRLRDTIAFQEGLARELDLAAEIQRGLLPATEGHAWPIHGLNRPIKQVSGDFFDFFLGRNGDIAFALGDVSGKGFNAALLMAKTASLFRCLGKTSDDPAALLAQINGELCETASHGMFVTMVAGVYHRSTGRVRFANAGHEPPLLRAPDRSYRSYPASGPPLGIVEDFSLEIEEAELGGGEFYVFTDGLTEYRYEEQEDLGVEGLVQLIESFADLPLEARLGALLAELDREGWEARDDLTLLAIDDGWTDS